MPSPLRDTEDKVGDANEAHTTAAAAPPLPLHFPWIPIGHPDTMMSKESVRRAVEDFQVRPTDILVATFPKTGTTLVIWICHLLRMRCQIDRTAMDGDTQTLYDYVPWPTLSWDIGIDPNTAPGNEQYSPRVFKSHLRMASIYRGGKYIVTIRDPAKTALSFYNFFKAKQVPLFSTMDASQFLLETPFIQGREGRASLWEYYQEYHLLRDCPSVLVLVYEDLVKHKKACLQIIAQFMVLPFDYDAELLANVARMSTKHYMADHMSIFDEPYERAKALGRSADLSQLAPGAKIASVEAPHPQTLSPRALDFLQEQWQKKLGDNYIDYCAFADVFRKRNEARFGVTFS
jgi:hypothetical protein